MRRGSGNCFPSLHMMVLVWRACGRGSISCHASCMMVSSRVGWVWRSEGGCIWRRDYGVVKMECLGEWGEKCHKFWS